MLTKKNVLLGSMIGSLPVIFLFIGKSYDYKDIFLILFVFLITLFFSLTTYFLPESVFRAWVNFTKWWVPLQIILVALTPEGTPGAFITILDKQFSAIVLSALFTVISLILIIWKYFASRRSTN